MRVSRRRKGEMGNEGKGGVTSMRREEEWEERIRQGRGEGQRGERELKNI